MATAMRLLPRAAAIGWRAFPPCHQLPGGLQQFRQLSGAPAAGSQCEGQGGSLEARYCALVAAGTLRPDPQQEQCVARLQRLCNDLTAYQQAMGSYEQRAAAYQAVRTQLREQLTRAEEQRLAAQEAAAAERARNGGGKGLLSWLGRAIGVASPPHQQQQQQQQQEEEEEEEEATQQAAPERRALLRARVEAAVNAQLGPPPPGPPAPKGVYLYGSVGSGKSLLMDLFFSEAATAGKAASSAGSEPTAAASAAAGEAGAAGEAPAATAAPLLARRLHFNAGLLELHSRMHALERDREQRDAKQMAVYAAAVNEQRQQQQREEEAAAGGGAPGAAAEGSSGANWAQQLLRLDPTAERIRRSKLARIAYRRMVREKLSRTPQEHSAALAAANASVVRNAARALIRSCDTLQLARASRSNGGGDRVAALLCFDELQVNDPFNAVALKGLMEALSAEGCVVVATSNRAPWELNRHGLHEDMFGHFTAHLMESCDVVQLSSQLDYRRLLAAPASTRPAAHSYFFPLGPHAEAAMRQQWEAVAAQEGGTTGPADLAVMFGRRLRVAQAAGGAGWFSFAELCAQPLGAADYISVAQSFHTVFLAGVPAMSMQTRDQARRFITLVDELYNHRVRLVCSAAVPPDELFAGADTHEPIIDMESLQFESAVEGSRLRRDLSADGGVAPVAASAAAAAEAAQRLGGVEEGFAFKRAVSRLHEMQAELYLASRPRGLM